jgi:lysophospholipase L1-like esterase
VIPAKPRVVVLYAGDNDLNAGKSPATVRDDYRVFRDKIHAALPETKIVVVSIKPSPSRWKLHEKAIEANSLLKSEVSAGKNESFVDVWTPMLGSDGMPQPDLFLKDNLHMNETGYTIWNDLIEPHLVRK